MCLEEMVELSEFVELPVVELSGADCTVVQFDYSKSFTSLHVTV